jgi:hypothetical protein
MPWQNESPSSSASIRRCSRRWAADDLRSLNGQIDYLLRRALQVAGRLPGTEPDRVKGGPKKVP